MQIKHIMFTFTMTIALLVSCTREDYVVIEENIIQIERNALDRWGKGDVYGYLDIYADEITYFDTATEKRLDGLSILKQRFEPIQGEIKIHHYDMIDPEVQVRGSTAVLTYNLIDYVAREDGTLREIRWNSTAVYTRIGNEWKIIHSHWAHTRPHDQEIDPNQPM